MRPAAPAEPARTAPAGRDETPAPPESFPDEATAPALTTATDNQTPPEPEAPPAREAAAPASRPLARGRELAALFNRGQLGRVWAAFLPSVRERWGNVSAFQQYRAAGLETYGAEEQLLNEAVMHQGDITYYTRTATFEREPGSAWTLVIGMDGDGRVQEFNVVAADPPSAP